MLTALLLFLSVSQALPNEAEQTSEELYMWVYANPTLTNSMIVEKLHDRSVDVLIADTKYKESLCVRLAKGGFIPALYILISRYDENERAKLLKASALRSDRGFTIAHYIVLHSKSSFWIDAFNEMGIDFSVAPTSEEDMDEMLKTRWGTLDTDAYRAYQALRRGKKK